MLGEADHVTAINYLARMEVLVMTPRWEGLPLLPLEAMHLGVPVVSTPVGGVPEVVRHEETGLLAETAEDLAAAVRRIRSDIGLKMQLIRRAKDVAATEFSEATMLTALQGVYDQTVASEAAQSSLVAQR